MIIKIPLIHVALLLCCCITTLNACPPAKLLIQGGWVWNGTEFVKNDLLIRNGKISAVGKGLSYPENTTKLQVSNQLVMPGLTDLHIHLFEIGVPEKTPTPLEEKLIIRNAERLFRAGITSARTHLFHNDFPTKIQRQSKHPCIAIPDLELGGPGLLGGAPTVKARQMWGVKNPEDARNKVIDLKKQGFSWLALHDINSFDPEELKAIVDESRNQALKIMVAGKDEAAIQTAIDIKAQTIEYLMRKSIVYSDFTLDKLTNPHVPLVVPPIGYYQKIDRMVNKSQFDKLDLHFLNLNESDFAQRNFSNWIRQNKWLNTTAEHYPFIERQFKQLLKNKVKIAMGSDVGSPGHLHDNAIWKEIRTWAKLGATTKEIIRAFSAVPAEVLAINISGEIKVGDDADLIIMQSPRTDIEWNKDNLHYVIKRGVPHNIHNNQK